jgi:hypothetical protein
VLQQVLDTYADQLRDLITTLCAVVDGVGAWVLYQVRPADLSETRLRAGADRQRNGFRSAFATDPAPSWASLMRQFGHDPPVVGEPAGAATVVQQLE